MLAASSSLHHLGSGIATDVILFESCQRDMPQSQSWEWAALVLSVRDPASSFTVRVLTRIARRLRRDSMKLPRRRLLYLAAGAAVLPADSRVACVTAPSPRRSIISRDGIGSGPNRGFAHGLGRGLLFGEAINIAERSEIQPRPPARSSCRSAKARCRRA